MKDKLYRLKYKDKWLEVIRVTGTYEYKAYDDKNDVKGVSHVKALAGRAAICDNCPDLDFDLIEIVEDS